MMTALKTTGLNGAQIGTLQEIYQLGEEGEKVLSRVLQKYGITIGTVLNDFSGLTRPVKNEIRNALSLANLQEMDFDEVGWWSGSWVAQVDYGRLGWYQANRRPRY